ncbi:ABC transporter substrate-binding protein [Pseudobacillus sp. FSL P4-0506]|uniref:ABC transporter substrate-binding protein n=1 Tax=unclassified Pseudobacillus TaxID=2619284 RepID=UPI0030F4FEA7
MRKAFLFFTGLTLLFMLAACSASEQQSAGKDSEAQAKESAGIEITDDSGQTITFDSAPESVATLSSGDLDILLALGANVTGRPTANGHVVKEMKNIPEIGNLHQPNFEKISEVHPAVLAAPVSFKQQAANIEQQGTKVLYTQANSVKDIQETITMYGKLLQKEAEAKELNKVIDEKKESVEKSQSNPVDTLLVYGAPGTYLAALPNSLSGDLLEKAGGKNIASDFPKEEKFPQYASLSVEKIIERNPQAVMLITHGDPEAVKSAFEKEMMKSAAWKNLDAVKNGNVVVLPSHLFGTNPGTKVTEALEVMKESLEKVK